MREKVLYSSASVAALLLVWNFYQIFLVLPDERDQGAIYRILFIHVPAAFISLAGPYLAMAFSLLYLRSKNLAWDRTAAALIEISWVFACVNLATGMLWGRIIWGIWWTWDARLTSMFTLWLLFGGYLMLRASIPEVSQRARLSAVLNVFAAVNVAIVYKSIEWWRTQHPAPVLAIRDGGGMAPGMEQAMWLNCLALALLSTAIVMVRSRQQAVSQEIEGLRRFAHAS